MWCPWYCPSKLEELLNTLGHSTNKTDHHNLPKILWKAVLNAITITHWNKPAGRQNILSPNKPFFVLTFESCMSSLEVATINFIVCGLTQPRLTSTIYCTAGQPSYHTGQANHHIIQVYSRQTHHINKYNIRRGIIWNTFISIFLFYSMRNCKSALYCQPL